MAAKFRLLVIFLIVFVNGCSEVVTDPAPNPTPNPSERPSSPASVTVNTYPDYSFITWTDNSSNETNFVIYRSDDGSSPTVELARVEANKTSYADYSVMAGYTYSYAVAALNDQGTSSRITARPPDSGGGGSGGGGSGGGSGTCCKVCTTGKPCGDSCIARNKNCNKGPGCACSFDPRTMDAYACLVKQLRAQGVVFQ